MNYFNKKKDNYCNALLAIQLLLLFLVSLTVKGQSLTDSCYIVPKTDGLLIQISKVDGHEEVIGNLGVDEVQAITFNSNADTLFAASVGQLGTIDINTGVFSSLSQPYGSGNGSLGVIDFQEVEGLTYDAVTSALFGSVKLLESLDILFRINPRTGAYIPDAFGAGIDYVTISGSGVLPLIEDLAISPLDNTMYGLSRETLGGDILIIIDKNTGVSEVVGPLGEDIIEGLGFDNGGRLFATPGASSSLPHRFYEIDITTGKANAVSVLTRSIDYESCDCLTAPFPNGPSNNNPVAVDDSYSVEVDSLLTVDPDGVLSNDSDPDGDEISILAYDTTSNAGGTVLLNPDGGFTYIPPDGFEGNDLFTYTITDGQGGTDTAQVNISVIKNATDPVANDDVYSTNQNTVLVIEAPGVLANDTDPNGDTLTVVDFDQMGTLGGSVQMNPDGSFTFTPATDSIDTDTFSYVVSDGNGNTDTAIVSVQIILVSAMENNPPIAENDSLMIDQDITLEITDPAEGVLANDSDPDGDNIAAQVVTNAITDQGGSISINEDGTISYTPATGFVGEDTYEYTICDDGEPELCDTATIVIEVKELPVKVFNAFSPNGDGRNDFWVIQGITRFPNNQVQIFNRWGNLVFKINGYDNTANVWQGQSTEGLVFGKNEVPDGGYFYIIDLGDGSRRLSGYVVIQR